MAPGSPIHPSSHLTLPCVRGFGSTDQVSRRGAAASIARLNKGAKSAVSGLKMNFPINVGVIGAEPRDVAARPRETLNKSLAYRIAHPREDDGYRARLLLRAAPCPIANCTTGPSRTRAVGQPPKPDRLRTPLRPSAPPLPPASTAGGAQPRCRIQTTPRHANPAADRALFAALL